MTPHRYQRLRQALSLRQPDLTVVTDEVHKGRNLSAIVRTCDAVGIDVVHTVAPRDGYRGFRGTASGSHKWVEVRVHQSLKTPVEMLKSQGFQIVGTAANTASRSYLDVDFTRPSALLLGSEKQGVSDHGLAQSDVLVHVPMVGMVESLNVSVAAAIILQEACRQRQQAGMYGTHQLSVEQQRQRFFTWAHPQVAAYCDERGLDYPEVSEDDGEILDPAAWYASVK